MENGESYKKRLAQAHKRVKGIKKFHRHLIAYVMISIVVLFVKINVFNVLANRGIEDENVLRWMQWNIIGIPVVWGIGLLFHALYVFVLKSGTISDLRPKFLKDWEERQIAKYMNEH